MKRDLAIGIEQLENGRYLTYDDTSVMQLADEVIHNGRKRLEKSRKKS